MKHGMGMMTGLLLLAACGEKGGSPQQQATMTPDVAGGTGQQAPVVVPSKTMGAESFHEITSTCATAPTSEVTMRLGNVFGGLDANGKISRNIKTGSNNVPKIDPAKLDNKTWPTNLDFDASSLGTGPVKVIIVLATGKSPDKPGLHFMRPRPASLPTGPDPSGTDSSVAVLVPQPESDFCNRTPIVVDAANNTESISFVMNRVMKTRSINIGLLVPAKANGNESQTWLPIFLDPNMRNEG
jgi:hypothetical protein